VLKSSDSKIKVSVIGNVCVLENSLSN